MAEARIKLIGDNAASAAVQAVGSSFGTLSLDILQAKQRVAELTKEMEESVKAGRGSLAQAIAGELDQAMPKLQALEAELKQNLKPALQTIEDAAPSTNRWADSLLTVNSALGLVGAGLSVGAVISFGKAVLDDADALTKMHDRTGISVEGLQRLQAAGDDAGNTVEQMTSAINQMQNRIADGNLEAASALRQLGIDFGDFKAMGPEQQFIAVSDAIRTIPDPARQTDVAMALLGRTAADVLPTLKRGFDDLRDASVGMSADTVEALDLVGDTWSRTMRVTKGELAEATVEVARFIAAGANYQKYILNEAEREADQLTESLSKMVAAMPAPGAWAKPVESFVLSEQAATRAAREAEEQVRATTAERKRAADEADRAAEKAKKALEKEAEGRTINAKALTEEIRLLKLRAGGTQLKEEFDALDPARNFSKVGKLMSRSLDDAIGPSLGESIAGKMPALIQQSFAGGGNPLKAVGSMVGSELGKSVVGNGLGGWLKDNLGKTIGGFAGSMVPVIGSLAGPLLSKLMSVGGPSQKELEGRQVKADFQAQFGSFDGMMKAVGEAYAATGRSAQQAQADVKALMDAERQGGEATQRMVDQIRGAMDEQRQDAADTEAAIKEFGFSFDELGPRLQKQNLDGQARTIMNQFRLLTQAGIDVGTVEDRMSDKISTYVQQVAKAGIEVPASMRPMLEKMAENGDIVDENGNKITDLAAAGVTFSESFSSAADRIVLGFERVMQQLGLLPAAAQAAADAVPDNPFADWQPPGGIADPNRDISLDVPSYANEGYDLMRPQLARVGDAVGDSESVLHGKTVRQMIADSRRAGAAAGDSRVITALREQTSALVDANAKLSRDIKLMMSMLPIHLRDAYA